MRLFALTAKSFFATLLMAILLLGCGGGSGSEKEVADKTESVAETPVAEATVEEEPDMSDNDDEASEPVVPIEPDNSREPVETEESMVAAQEEETAETIEIPINTVDPIESAEPLETLEPIEAPQPKPKPKPTAVVGLEKAEEASPPNILEDYQVVLTVDSNFKLNKKGVLKVWIGAEENKEVALPGKAQDETSIPASIGQYAKITPFAPNFEVDPLEYKCVKIDPSGSSVRFTIIPTKKGNLTVSANIELYDNAECTGTPVPKSAAQLTVKVVVDRRQNFLDKTKEMEEIAWDKFMIFWGALLALVFGFILYLIRRKMNKKTGYDGE